MSRSILINGFFIHWNRLVFFRCMHMSLSPFSNESTTTSLIVKRNEYDCLESKNTIWNAFSFVLFHAISFESMLSKEFNVHIQTEPLEYLSTIRQTFSLWPNKRSENRFEFIFRLYRWLMICWGSNIHAIFSKLNIWCPFEGTVKLSLLNCLSYLNQLKASIEQNIPFRYRFFFTLFITFMWQIAKLEEQSPLTIPIPNYRLTNHHKTSCSFFSKIRLVPAFINILGLLARFAKTKLRCRLITNILIRSKKCSTIETTLMNHWKKIKIWKTEVKKV